MSLRVGPVIPVSDLARAREFYEGQLGFSGARTPGGYQVRCGAFTVLYLLEAPDDAGTASWPLASFATPDLRADTARLKARGVPFLHDVPFETDDEGVSEQDGMLVSWMTDPDGQVLTLVQLPGDTATVAT